MGPLKYAGQAVYRIRYKHYHQKQTDAPAEVWGCAVFSGGLTQPKNQPLVSRIWSIGVRAQSTLGQDIFAQKYMQTRNTLDCDQSNYSSRIVFSHIPLHLIQLEIAPFDPPTPKTLPSNQTWSGSDDPLASRRYGHLKFSQMWGWSVGPQYILLLTLSHILLFATLGT